MSINVASLHQLAKRLVIVAGIFTVFIAQTSYGAACATLHGYGTWDRSYDGTAIDTPCVYYPTDQSLYEMYPNAFLYYYGVTVSDPLLRILDQAQIHRWPEHIQSLEG